MGNEMVDVLDDLMEAYMVDPKASMMGEMWAKQVDHPTVRF
jgi:hypothetical protein